jgi:hypothetical protein
MAALDPQVPESVVRRVREEQPRSEQWSDDLKALLTPSIEARSLSLEGTLNISKRLNTEVEYFWARDRNGMNPNHQRVGQLREAGFDFATSDSECKHEKDCKCDVIMRNSSVVMGKSEIRCGDLVLMKVDKRIWMGIRKQQQLDSLNQTSSRSARGDRNLMTTMNALPGVKTDALSDLDVRSMKDHAVYDTGATTIEERLSGNATRVNKRS